MMIPRKRNDFDLFDEMFGMDPFFERRDAKLMKTDIKEKGDKYIIDIDLPGYDKENIDLEIEDGYLKVSAKVDKNIDESDEEEKYIHQERFYGECSRSFYIGKNIKEEDIKASFKKGILTLTIPKEEQKKL
ncbi:MAG TPA: Hsp20/alpha crystallin family protein [Candidatus Scatovivens faecipullorum]|nr:Hsp20/alpha crystallin family protein [Candidatus Scatovivens faecipullorum]